MRKHENTLKKNMNSNDEFITHCTKFIHMNDFNTISIDFGMIGAKTAFSRPRQTKFDIHICQKFVRLTSKTLPTV